jgi:hypothetical protein
VLHADVKGRLEDVGRVVAGGDGLISKAGVEGPAVPDPAFLGTTAVPVNVVQSIPGPLIRLALSIPLGTLIDRLVIGALNTRAKLLRLCWEPTA